MIQVLECIIAPKIIGGGSPPPPPPNKTCFAGSDAKVEYLRSLGFDAAYNYKKVTDLDATLKEACPNRAQW